MSVQENKELARRIVEEGWNHPDRLDAYLAEDVAWHPSEMRGLEAYKQACLGMLAGLPDFSYTVEDMVAEGAKVAVRWQFSGTHTGEWAGVPATGKQISLQGATTFQFAGGKVQEQWNVWFTYWQAEQLGIVPAWGEAARKARGE